MVSNTIRKHNQRAKSSLNVSRHTFLEPTHWLPPDQQEYTQLRVANKIRQREARAFTHD